ncbi:hypothetical protein [Falsiroseomonas oryziterrae]|uniref:hypothetical protein n=1 Tax=Falsiroseomonas oryziterrae TaxID=2911368 RepID=UPI001F22C50D|nr:hypothetical protein [Roseomonas sp. NPKOSM-4]
MTRQRHALARAGWLCLFLALGVLYGLLLAWLSGSPRALHGLVFNDMAARLMAGRFDIDPAVIGAERFERDGRSFAYFGILPAVLRMPLVGWLGLGGFDMTRQFKAFALALGAAAQAAAVIVAFRPLGASTAAGLLKPPLVSAALLSGPPVMLAMRPSIFDETAAWAWAFASIFAALVLHGLTRSGGLRTSLLCLLALVAGLCLLTRPTTALGLYLSLALLMLWLACSARNGVRPRPSELMRRLLSWQFLLPAAVASAFVLVAGGINVARWGNPFTVADLRAQVDMIAIFPDRLPRLEEYGLFNLGRLGYGLIYYFFPVWVLHWGSGLVLGERILVLFDAFELPPSSFLISDPLTMALAALGVVALARNRLAGVPRGGALALVGGLCVAPALMLTAWYMAFRYRLEFQPLFFTLACLGAASWAARDPAGEGFVRSWRVRFVVGLWVLQIASAHLHALAYVVSPFGPGHPHLSVSTPALNDRRIGFAGG